MIPLVSIIIPFFSGKEWLCEALESCVNQTYKNIEIILLNDGSEENIDDVLKYYKNRIKYYYHQNIGAAATRNKGIMQANGDYVAFLDSDDIWYIDKLNVQMTAMLANDYKWSHCSYELFEDKTKKIVKTVLSGKVKDNHCSNFVYVCKVATPTVVIKRDVLLEHKFSFKENLKYGEDTYLWIQMASEYPICGIDDVFVKVRLHGKNAARNIDAQIIGRGSVLENISDFKTYKINYIGKKTYQYCTWLRNLCESRRLSSKFKFVLFFPAWIMFKALNKLL